VSWIPVSEQPVPLDEDVLVYTSSSLVAAVVFGEQDYADCTACEGYERESPVRKQDVTHWMPFPEPPK
jgi:hypothetical protein